MRSDSSVWLERQPYKLEVLGSIPSRTTIRRSPWKKGPNHLTVLCAAAHATTRRILMNTKLSRVANRGISVAIMSTPDVMRKFALKSRRTDA